MTRKFRVTCTEVHTATYEVEVEAEGDIEARIEARTKWEQTGWEQAVDRSLGDSSGIHIEEMK